jgi:hypothetical protein
MRLTAPIACCAKTGPLAQPASNAAAMTINRCNMACPQNHRAGSG